jgi:hypothetical protein
VIANSTLSSARTAPLKIAEFAPTPSAIVMTAISVKPGCFSSDRNARRSSPAIATV